MNKSTNFICLTVISILNFISKLEAIKWNEHSALIVTDDGFHHRYDFPQNVTYHSRDELRYIYDGSEKSSTAYYFCPEPEYFNSDFRYCLFGKVITSLANPTRICLAPVESVTVKIREKNEEISCGRGNYKGSLYEVRYELCEFVKTPWWNIAENFRDSEKKEKKIAHTDTLPVYQFCYKTAEDGPSDSSNTLDATEATETADMGQGATSEAALGTEAVEKTDELDASRRAGEQLYSYFDIHAPKLLHTHLDFLLEEQKVDFEFDTNSYGIFQDDLFDEMESIREQYRGIYYPQMVASPMFKAFALARKPHYHYSNVKFMPYNSLLSWRITLNKLKNKIVDMEIPVTMYFGTFDVIERLEMKNGRFLNIPGTWWTLVYYYQKSTKLPRKGVSILMSIKMNSKQTIYCEKSICAEAGLQNVVYTDDRASVYCCPVATIASKMGLPEADLLEFFHEEESE